MKFLSLLVLSLLSLTNGAELRVYEASSSSARTGNPLPAMVTLCPSELFDSSFTIECVAEAPATSATFMVDSMEIRTERVVPYTLTGDIDGFARPWVDYPMTATVMCSVSNGETAESTITFACGDEPMPTPALPDEPEGESPIPPTKTPRPQPGKPAAEPTEPAPEPSKPAPEPSKPAPEPSKPAPEPSKPAPAPVMQDPEPTPMPPAPSAMNRASSLKCVKIPATSYKSTSEGWVMRDGGMAFKPDDPDMGIDGEGDAPLVFKFTAPATSRYAVTLDMKTSDPVEHNDVWLYPPAGGFSLEKQGSKETSTDWTKAYHNQNGRAVEAFSVDFDPHAFSTKSILKAGQEYSIRLGGRSTKVTVYSIVLFTCNGGGCMIGTHFNNGVNKCA